MALVCLTGARMNMSATLLHQDSNYDGGDQGVIDVDEYGEWKDSQDPLTGEIVKIWVPYDKDPTKPSPPPLVTDYFTIPCIARGIVDGGIRVAGTTERFGDTYENIDYVKMWIPPHITVTKRDRVTNIKDPGGRIRWIDEEYEQRDPRVPVDERNPATFNMSRKATVFNVNGVTPLYNAFNRLTEWFVLLEKADV